MENKDMERKTSLTFEFVTEEKDSSKVDITPQMTKEEKPREKPEGQAAVDIVNTDSVGIGLGFRPTYVPRFTSVSDTYKMSDGKKFGERVPDCETHTAQNSRDSLDPTDEAVENAQVEKLVVTPMPDRIDSYSDESIRVYKFDEPEQIPVSIPDECEDTEGDEEFSEALECPPGLNRDEETVCEAEETEEKTPKEQSTHAAVRRIFDTSSFFEKRSEDEPSAELDRGGKRPKNEFKTSIQRDEIKDKFIDSLISVRIRMVFAALVAVFALAFEFLSFFDGEVLESMSLPANIGAYLDILFSTALILIALPEVLRFFRGLFSGSVGAEIIIPVAYLLICGLSVTVILFGEGKAETMSFTLLFAAAVLVALVGSYVKISADFTSFKLISRGEAKSVADIRLTRTLECENIALDGVIDEYDSRTLRVFKTAFVSDFVGRSSRTRENSLNSLLTVLASLLLGLIVGTSVYFLTDSAYPIAPALESLTLVLLLSVPVFSLLLHKLPFLHAIVEARNEKSTFIGEEAIYETAQADVIGYDDTDIFGAEDVSLKKVHLYGKVFNTVKAMKEMYSIFSSVGGPLLEVFSSALDRKCPSATGVAVEKNGISGTFEGHTVMAGTEEYMRSHGVTIPEDDYKTKTFATDSTKVMYGAEDGEVYVKFFIRYSFSEEFTMILPELRKNKITPLIYTKDPNIDCELLRMLTLDEDIIRVVKLEGAPKESKVYRRLTSGLASLGDRSSIVNTVLLSKRYTALESSLLLAERILASAGALFAAVLALVFMDRLCSIPSFALVLWQIAWCGLLGVFSHICFRAKRSAKDK